MSKTFARTLVVVLAAAIWSPAQIRPGYDIGVLGLSQQIKRIGTTASALMIGAHPDDEDTALLAYLARGEGARTAYLSLTRGDGGQNILGPELGEALGIIRTEELLQARKLDGAEQFFTRAYDYGFSKTLAEARAKWEEGVILCDVVRVVRHFRPMVVISQFSGTPQDGHGHHQFAGHISPLAVKAAADPQQCRDSGPVWKVAKFYVRHRGQGEPTLRVNTGRFDPMYGRSYFEIAMEARSQHRSQEQGVLELRGEMFSMLQRIDAPAATENGLFSGLDTSIAGLAAIATPDAATLRDLDGVARQLAAADIRSADELVPLLIRALRLVNSLGSAPEFAAEKRSQLIAAIKLAAGIQVDALVPRETVVAGEEFPVEVKAYYPNGQRVSAVSFDLVVSSSWEIAPSEPPAAGQQQGFFRRETPRSAAHFRVKTTDVGFTEPYWLLSPRTGDMFDWRQSLAQTAPFQPPAAYARVVFNVGGESIVIEQPLEFRYADDIQGEIRRGLSIVPAYTIETDRDLIISPVANRPVVKAVSVTVTNSSVGAGKALIALSADDASIKIGPPRLVEFKRRGERVNVSFNVTVPAVAGVYSLRASAETEGGRKLSVRQRTIEYPHIRTHRMYDDPVVTLRVLDLKVAPVRVGYIMGSGDRVAEAIRQLGVDVGMIDERELASGDLSRYDTIVVGVRAYQVRPDLAAHNQRLHEFMSNGGTLIVQYQLPPTYSQLNLPPYPAQTGPRVADENAPVTILEPAHAIFNFPNKIQPQDLDGWVQERNLYNFSTMDARYTGLLEAHDPGEPENKGGLVIADVGKGKFVYCSYSLFRQLPAGVPGAYRLLANLISVPKAPSASPQRRAR
jgi:LmbE family N-acetylglucosaminyl deacetylase